MLVVSTRLTAEPASAPGSFDPFTVMTEDGAAIQADLWFRCYGLEPVSDYLGSILAYARTSDGLIAVNHYLQVPLHQRVVVAGEIADLPEPKMAGAAGKQAASVVGNITRLIQGETTLEVYEPLPRHLLVPLGPGAGAGQRMGREDLSDGDEVADIKGRDLLVGYYRKILGLA
jgi:NADH dehydrogenase FAD-containing subunit